MRNLLVFIIALFAVAGVYGAYSGAEYYQTVSIAAANVSEDGDYAVYIDLSEMPAAWWAKATARSKIVFTNGSDTKLKSYVDAFDATGKTGIAWCKATLSTSTGGTIRVQAGSTINESNDAATFTDLGIVLRYAFEEASGDAADATGSYTGTVTGPDYGVVGAIGRAYDFERDNSDRVTNDTAANWEDDQPFTVTLWMKRESIGTVQYPLSRMKGTDPYNGWGIRYLDTNIPALLLVSTGGSAMIASGPEDASIDWHHIAFSTDGTATTSGTIMVKNGVSQNITATQNNYSGALSTAALPLNVGAVASTVANFDGMIDEVRIMNAAKSADYLATSYKIQNHETSAFYTLGATWVIGGTKNQRGSLSNAYKNDAYKSSAWQRSRWLRAVYK